MKTEESMSINICDLIDKKVKYQFDKKDQLNNDLREQLYRVRVELAELKRENKSLKGEYEKLIENEKVSTNMFENIRERIEKEDNLESKKEIIDYYFDVILCLDHKYEIPPHFGVKSISKMISYYFYVYNDYKDIVKTFLLNVLPNNYKGHIYSASSYIVPQKASKEVLTKLIEEQPYYTNGGHTDWNEYCFPDYPPYSEYMKNPLILNDEVFQCLCDNVCRKSESYTFLEITKYQELTDKQIEMLGEGMLLRCNDKEIIRNFFYQNHANLSLDFHRKIFQRLGYSTNEYYGSYILNFRNEIIKEILSNMDYLQFGELYSRTYGKRDLLKMYLEIIRNK